MQLEQQAEFQHLVMDGGVGRVVKAQYSSRPSKTEMLLVRTDKGRVLEAPVTSIVNWKIGHKGQKYLGAAERFRQFLKYGTPVTFQVKRGKISKLLEWDPVLFNYVWPLVRMIRYGKLIDDTLWEGRDINQMWKDLRNNSRKGRLEVYIRGEWVPYKEAVL